MVAFVSLFLGLVLYEQPVQVLVGDNVAAVEIRLDGASVGVLQGPPWSLPCDFGDTLAPHKLEAIALDEAGAELSRIHQWINLPQPPATVAILLEREADGQAKSARLTWESAAGPEPQAISVTFDGEPVPVEDPRHISLPPHNPAQLHFLRAELDFADNVSSVAELTFGGTYTDEINFELTALPVWVERGARLPPAEELTGWFTKAGQPIEVVAVEKGPAEVVVVPDEGILETFIELARGVRTTSLSRLSSARQQAQIVRFAAPLKAIQRLRFVWPEAQRKVGSGGLPFELFPRSQDFTAQDGGFLWLTIKARRPTVAGSGQRLADALGVAGLSAAGRKRRRAAVLLLSDQTTDGSRLTAVQAEGYLRAIHVPLFVWSATGSDPHQAWGELTDISSVTKLEKAVRALGKALERQRIVWLSGTYLPQDIALSTRARGLSLTP